MTEQTQDHYATLAIDIVKLVKRKNEVNEAINYFRSVRRFRTCDILSKVRNGIIKKLEAAAGELDKCPEERGNK